MTGAPEFAIVFWGEGEEDGGGQGSGGIVRGGTNGKGRGQSLS